MYDFVLLHKVSSASDISFHGLTKKNTKMKNIFTLQKQERTEKKEQREFIVKCCF